MSKPSNIQYSKKWLEFLLQEKEEEIERLNSELLCVKDDFRTANDEIERLRHNQEVSTKWEIELTSRINKAIGLIYDYQMNDEDNVNYKELLYVLKELKEKK